MNREGHFARAAGVDWPMGAGADVYGGSVRVAAVQALAHAGGDEHKNLALAVTCAEGAASKGARLGMEKDFAIFLDDDELTVEHFESLRTLARYVHGVLVEQRQD